MKICCASDEAEGNVRARRHRQSRTRRKRRRAWSQGGGRGWVGCAAAARQPAHVVRADEEAREDDLEGDDGARRRLRRLHVREDIGEGAEDGPHAEVDEEEDEVEEGPAAAGGVAALACGGLWGGAGGSGGRKGTIRAWKRGTQREHAPGWRPTMKKRTTEKKAAGGFAGRASASGMSHEQSTFSPDVAQKPAWGRLAHPSRWRRWGRAPPTRRRRTPPAGTSPRPSACTPRT